MSARPKVCILRAVAVLVVAGVLVLALGTVLSSAGAARAQQVDRVALAQQWMEIRNRGDVDAAMALLTDTAVAAHGPCPLQSPCVGEANRPFIASGTQHTITSIQVSGSAVVGQLEIRNAATRAAGVERAVRTFLIQMPQDKIAAYIAIPDLTDSQTAQLAGVQQSPP